MIRTDIDASDNDFIVFPADSSCLVALWDWSLSAGDNGPIAVIAGLGAVLKSLPVSNERWDEIMQEPYG